MGPTDYLNISRSPSPAMDWDQMYCFNEEPILMGEDDLSTCDLAPSNPYRPCLASEVITGEMNGRSVLGSTVGTGGLIPSSYSEQPAKRARDVTTAEEGPGPSVKRSRGAITEYGTLDVQELIVGYAGDIIITGEGPGASVKHSEATAGKNLLDGTLDLEQLIARYAGGVTTAEEGLGSSVKCFSGAMTEENRFLRGKIVECARDIVTTVVKYSEITTGKILLDKCTQKRLIIGCASEIATTAINFSVGMIHENLLDKTLQPPITGCTGDGTTAEGEIRLFAKCPVEGMAVGVFLRQRIFECARDIVTTAVKYSETTTGEKLLDNDSLQTVIVGCDEEITATAINYSGAITGENLLENMLQPPIARCTGDATTAGEDFWSSVQRSGEQVIGGDVLEVLELITGYKKEVTTAEKGHGPSVKSSIDEALLDLALRQLGMTREEMINDDNADFEREVHNSYLSEGDKALLRDSRRKCKNLLSQRKSRGRKAQCKTDLHREVDNLRVIKANLEKRVLEAEQEITRWKKKCDDLDPNNSSFMEGWDQIDNVEDRQVTVREDNSPACGSILSSNCMPHFTPEVTAWETSGSSAIKSTVGRGASRPPPYSVPSARRANITTTGKTSQPSVRCSGEVTTGENVSNDKLQLGGLIAGCVGDITTTEEVPGPSVEPSRGTVTVGSLLEAIEAQERLAPARYVTTTEEAPQPPAKHSRGAATSEEIPRPPVRSSRGVTTTEEAPLSSVKRSRGVTPGKRHAGNTTTGKVPRPPAKHSRGVTTTEETPLSSVKRSGGATSGKRHADNTTTGKEPRPLARSSRGAATSEEIPRPPVRSSRGVTTAKEAPLSSVKRSRGATSGKRHVDNTTTGKAPRPFAKPSGGITTDKDLLKNALDKLGINEDRIITCTDEELNEIISNPFLSMQEIAQLKNKRYRVGNNKASRESRARGKKINSETEERVRELESKNEELKEKIAAFENDLEMYKAKIVEQLARAKSVEV